MEGLSIAYTLRNHFALQNTIIWVKSISISNANLDNNPNTIKDFSVGHFKPIPSDKYLNNCYEFIYHFTKKGDIRLDKLAIGVPYKDKSNIKR